MCIQENIHQEHQSHLLWRFSGLLYQVKHPLECAQLQSYFALFTGNIVEYLAMYSFTARKFQQLTDQKCRDCETFVKQVFALLKVKTGKS